MTFQTLDFWQKLKFQNEVQFVGTGAFMAGQNN